MSLTKAAGPRLLDAAHYRKSVADGLETFGTNWRPMAGWVLELCRVWYQRGQYDARAQRAAAKRRPR